MKSPLMILAIVAILGILSGGTDAGERQAYHSVDGKFRAEIVEVRRSAWGTGESKVVLRSANGKIMCSRSYVSKDGAHGFVVEEAAWTPDSKFFVYSLLDSGGQQPWRAPIHFISIQGFKVLSLDDHTGPITDPHFEISEPDVVHGIGQSRGNPGERKFEVSLSSVLKAKNPPAKQTSQPARRK